MTKICKYDHSEIKMFVSSVHFPMMFPLAICHRWD